MSVSNWHKQENSRLLKPILKVESKFSIKYSAEFIFGTFICCKCKLEKMSHHFASDKSRALGLSPRCKNCDYERNKKIRRKMKQEIFSSF